MLKIFLLTSTLLFSEIKNPTSKDINLGLKLM